jgi:uncharacterized protein (TIGR00251 family)
MRICVRVLPRSSKNEIRQEGDIYKVHLTAPPVDGAANEALLKLLSERLGVARRSLHIVQGASARQKIIQIDEQTGLTDAEIASRLR